MSQIFEGHTNPTIPSPTLPRRASFDTPLPHSSFTPFPTISRAVVQTPGGKHLDFAPSATLSSTPFTQTLNYFKQYKDKETSPSKRRRKASSPEEIAELAREARVEEQEAKEEEGLKELEKFREIDLAPIEPVMEGGVAGDLVLSGTPVRARGLGIEVDGSASGTFMDFAALTDSPAATEELSEPNTAQTPAETSTSIDEAVTELSEKQADAPLHTPLAHS